MAFVRLSYDPNGGDFSYRVEMALNTLEHGVDIASNAGRTFPKAFSAVMSWYTEQVSEGWGHGAPMRVELRGPVLSEDRRLLENFVRVHELICHRKVDPRIPVPVKNVS